VCRPGCRRESQVEQIEKFRPAFNERRFRQFYNDNINVGPVAAFTIGYRPEGKRFLYIMFQPDADMNSMHK
jgi:hypothetical protein